MNRLPESSIPLTITLEPKKESKCCEGRGTCRRGNACAKINTPRTSLQKRKVSVDDVVQLLSKCGRVEDLPDDAKERKANCKILWDFLRLEMGDVICFFIYWSRMWKSWTRSIACWQN